MKQEVFKYLDSQILPENIEEKRLIKELKDYFNIFYRKVSNKSVNNIIKLTDKEIILALIILRNPTKIKEIIALINKYPELFPKDNYDEIIGIIITYYKDEFLRHEIDKCLKKSLTNQIFGKRNLMNLFHYLGLPPKSCEKFYLFTERHPNALRELRIVFESFEPQDNNMCILLIQTIIDFKEIVEDEDNKEFAASLSKKGRKMFKKFIMSEEEAQAIKDATDIYFERIDSLYNNFVREYEQKEKERKKQNKSIAELKRLLDVDGEIKNIDNILSLCWNAEIKEKVIDYILAYNKQIYIRLVEEFERTRQNSDENLTKLFNQYGFNYETLDSEERSKLRNNNYEAIEDLLKRLKTLAISNINVSKVSVYKLSLIENLITKGIINSEWLQKNINLFYEDNNELESVITNLDTLSKEGINMLQYSNSLDIIKSPILKFNLYLLKVYGLTITKNTTDINFLASNDLRGRIELLYSIVSYSELTELDILNMNILDILKLKIANSLNIPFECIDDTSEIFYDFATDIIPSDIQNKLAQELEFVSDIPQILEVYSSDRESLNINGVLVSREKIKRNLAKIGNNDAISCFYAIIYNGYYTYEEIMCLQAVLIPEESLINKNQVRN